MPSWLIDITGGVAAFLGAVVWLPQTWKTLRTRDTKSLSLWSNFLLLVTISLWLVYGVAIGSWPLIVGNWVSIVLVGTIVVLKIRHG